MAKRGDPRVLQLLVIFFLDYSGLSQQALGERAGIDQGTISDSKRGLVPAPEKNLRRLAGAAGVPWPAVVHLRRFYAALLASMDRRSAADGVAEVALDAIRLAVAPFFLETGETPPEVALAEAKEIWAALEPLSMPRRKHLLGLAPRASRSWALAVELCEASERTAAHEAGEALELAGLALSIAERVPGNERSPKGGAQPRPGSGRLRRHQRWGLWMPLPSRTGVGLSPALAEGIPLDDEETVLDQPCFCRRAERSTCSPPRRAPASTPSLG